MKRFLIAAAMFLLPLASVRSWEPAADSELIRSATFSIETEGATLNFVLLNNQTVEALFSGPSKFSVRARANKSTVFFVDGKARKKFDLVPKFKVLQNSQVIDTKSINIKNFESGPVAEGAQIQGLVELGQKLNLYQAFRLRDTRHEYPEHQYDWDVVEKMKE